MPDFVKPQLELLFKTDQLGRLVSNRDPENSLPPKIFIARSMKVGIIKWREDLNAELVDELRTLGKIAHLKSEEEARRKPPAHKEILQKLEGHGKEYFGPAFTLEGGSLTSPQAKLINQDNRSVVEDSEFKWVLDNFEFYSPVVMILKKRKPVSICHSPRGILGGVSEAGVFTLQDHRGRGYGALAVSVWARALQSQGVIPIYSTTWDNQGSLGIARKLGAKLFGQNWHVS